MLLPGQEAHFYLELPDPPAPPSEQVVLWGGLNILYADIHEATLSHTSIFVREYRAASHPSDFVVSANPAPRRYDRKRLLKKAGRQPRAKLEDPREGWPLSALWIAAHDPQEGIVLGHP